MFKVYLSKKKSVACCFLLMLFGSSAFAQSSWGGGITTSNSLQLTFTKTVAKLTFQEAGSNINADGKSENVYRFLLQGMNANDHNDQFPIPNAVIVFAPEKGSKALFTPYKGAMPIHPTAKGVTNNSGIVAVPVYSAYSGQQAITAMVKKLSPQLHVVKGDQKGDQEGDQKVLLEPETITVQGISPATGSGGFSYQANSLQLEISTHPEDRNSTASSPDGVKITAKVTNLDHSPIENVRVKMVLSEMSPSANASFNTLTPTDEFRAIVVEGDTDRKGEYSATVYDTNPSELTVKVDVVSVGVSELAR